MHILDLLGYLILFPLIAAIFLLFERRDSSRSLIVQLSAVAIGIVSLLLLVLGYNRDTLLYAVGSEQVGQVMFFIELLMVAFILYLAVKHRKTLAAVLVLLQAGLLVWFETSLSHGLHVANNLFVDQFSIIMALIIGIIGTLICVYAVGYMETYHTRHPEVRDRRNIFFAILFLFLAAMFGLVFSNNLLWVFFFWEITTLCSFLLIGYSETEEATNNSFLALVMNLLGGLAFLAALIWLVLSDPSGRLLDLNYLLTTGKALALVPAVLICFAGITKAALMPFSSWLVGAMVAPTPVSALLHSSTMVKAGVYIIVKFAPVLSGTTEGLMIALVGGMTFALASFMAISQNNAKKVLAYSTIANLGLIVACAGVGTYNLMWVAILLIIFHAIAKSLLFLCVGTVENRIGSRNIEDMGGLIVRMPRIAIMMFIGMAGMFLAPFGMVISKWAAIEAFIQAPFGLIFIAILAFGGSATVFFWSKWMGKIISVMREQEVLEDTVKKEKWVVLWILTGLVVVVCLIFPVISWVLIEPFVLNIYGQTAGLAQANLTIMIMMLCLLMIMPLSMLFYRKGPHVPATPYMGGRPMDGNMHFAGSLGNSREVVLSNYYLEKMFGEERLFMIGTSMCWGLLLIAGIMLVGVML
ncbi:MULTISPECIES: proton-conducting transporter membrane subunit [unclassified Methanoregula]|uniref:NADH-quinone oxidoreductase subunit 5 family protein n=1 Tax=unclassified Methanoregula TaxID=2649730 RepID=UPI00341A18CC